jgi:hypothetical protein
VDIAASESHFLASYDAGPVRRAQLWLARNSAVAGLLARHGLWPSPGIASFATYKAWAEAYPDYGAVWDGGPGRTVFRTGAILIAIDLGDPRVSEGLRLTTEVLAEMGDEARAHGAHLAVVGIPSKLSAFAGLMRGSAGGVNPSFARALDLEARVRNEVAVDCRSHGVPFLDALPALSAAAARGERISRAEGDMHFNARGYAAIAETAAAGLHQLGWLRDTAIRPDGPAAPPATAARR